MIIDNDKPWEESPSKKPKLGGVLEAILEIQKNNTSDNDEIKEHLKDVENNVKELLEDFNNDLDTITDQHTNKRGAVHNETKASIGLGKKDNYPAASIDDITNGRYKKEWLTPKTLSKLIDKELNINPDLYIKSGVLPLSYGVTLGRSLFNQRYITKTKPNIDKSAFTKNISSFLFSTEESYLLFGDHGRGIETDFSTGGIQAPIGPTIIDIRNDNIITVRSNPCSLNDITISDTVAKSITGLGFGFGDDNGNFYDSNFHPTVSVENTVSYINDSVVQCAEVSLFDKSIIYKPEGKVTLRNFNSTLHNFTELTFPTDVEYDVTSACFLSSDEIFLYISNTMIINKNGIYGISFNINSGNIGTPDWLPSTFRKANEKILSKKSTFTPKQTTVTSITGYEGATSAIVINNNTTPFGFSTNRENLRHSNFNNSPRSGTVFIPIEALIKGFNNLTVEQQSSIVNRIDKELLKRVTLAWDNKLAYKGLLRTPFYLIHTNATEDNSIGFHMWVDISFNLNLGNDYNTIEMSALNFDTNQRPSFDSSLNLTGNLGKFINIENGIKDNPIHPKVIGGCFVETGGHIQTYVVGYRQYICYYKHQIKNKKEWIKDNLTPVITETKIKDIGLFPTNGAYGDNLRLIPTSFDNTTINYLAYIRNKKNKYQYATLSLPLNYKLENDTLSKTLSFKWLDNGGNKDIPVLIHKTDFTKNGFNISGMVFNEDNNFIGSYNPNFDGVNFTPNTSVRINEVLRKKIIINANLDNPYPIFFYYNSVLYWVIMDLYGVKNELGKNIYLGGVRVDIYEENDGSYEIRKLETVNEVYHWGVFTEEELSKTYYGRNHESFDDVFVISKPDDKNKLKVFINYPMLPTHYFDFDIQIDGLGYYYPVENSYPKITSFKHKNGYGITIPHNLYPTYMSPLVNVNSFYSFNENLYSFRKYDNNGLSTLYEYFMGWKDEYPLYLVGSNLTISGKSQLVEQTIKMDNLNLHNGALFINYSNNEPVIYSTGNNPNSLDMEPNINNVFVGFWTNYNDHYMFSYHAPRGISNMDYADFLNSLLPVIDNVQMSPFAMGSTFPLYLGKLRTKPTQYFFRK